MESVPREKEEGSYNTLNSNNVSSVVKYTRCQGAYRLLTRRGHVTI